MTAHERDLEGFRRTQRLAYDAALATERLLEPGMTERDAAALLGEACRARGSDGWFHEPFAWFGDRTMFAGFTGNPLQFMPTRRRLQPGMPVILDVAPLLDGYTADIGYATSLGPNATLQAELADLAEFRTLILEQVRQRVSVRALYDAVDDRMRALGYLNCHSVYPLGTLAHQVSRHAFVAGPVRGLALESVVRLGLGRLRAMLPASSRETPVWGSDRRGRPSPGLWAVEPHLGRDGVGAKWEELLVVTERDAYWLDDDVPHVRRWSSAGGARSTPLHVPRAA